jgi:hypothetical protein
MRTRSALLFALTIASPSLAAHAGSTHAAQVTQFKGTQAATFVAFGPNAVCADGSIGTANGFGFISGSDSVFRQPGTPASVSNGASIDIFDYSTSCNSDFIGFGIAGLAGGYTAPNPQLTTASLSGTTTVQDLDSGLSFPLSLNLVFTGQGPRTSSKGTTVSHDQGGYTVIVSRGAFSSREAGVTGTITIDGVEVDASFSSTDLVSNSSGQTTVIKK